MSDFWSRRRAAVAAETEAEVQADLAFKQAEERATEEARVADLSDAELLAELDLPDPDTMQAGDDFAAFMKQAVPERLRRRALRRLWMSNPVLANVDMLVDYGEDFTDSALVVENLQTAYQVGKGMKAHVEALAQQARDKAAAAAQSDVAEEPEDEAQTAEANTETDADLPADIDAFEGAASPHALAETDPAIVSDDASFPEEETAPIRRRMRFSFET